MKKLMILAAALISSNVLAEEMCGVLKTVNGQVKSVMEPCSLHEHPVSCTKEKMEIIGGKKWITFEAVPCPPGKQKTVEQIQREENAAQKRKCGKDFMALRVGMTLDRFEECHEALAYVTETVGKNGTVETYRSTFYLIDARGGKIVSYTKRRF